VLGGASAPAELELDGAMLTLRANSEVLGSGAAVVEGRTSTLVVTAPAVLTNHGALTVAYAGLQLEGDLTNAPDGSVNFLGSQGWEEPGNAGALNLVGASTFKNEGDVWLDESGSIQAPYAGTTGAVIDNAGGTIHNAGNIRVDDGGTFIEGNGDVVGSDTGNYYVVQVDGGALVLAGEGRASFQVAGATKISGTIAPNQVLVTISSQSLATVGSLINEGTIATQYAVATLTVPAGATLYNVGTILAVHGNTLNIAGHVDNEAAGNIDAAGGTFALEGSSSLTNHGTISVTGSGNFDAPEVDTSGSTFDNAGGRIVDDGMFQVVNGTFIEGAGTEAGNPVHLSGNGVLDLRGRGASSFEFDGGRIEGDIAKDQSVSMVGPSTLMAPAKFTNFGTLTARSVNIVLPPGGTFTNEGTLNSPPTTQELVLYGNLVNGPGAVFNMNGAGGYGGNLYLLRPGTAFYNRGTLEMAGAFVDLEGVDQTFDNTGTVVFGVVGGGWGGFGLHSGIQATAGGADIILDGVIDPIFNDGTEPAPPWPSTAKTITYQVMGGSGGSRNVFNVSCDASVGGHWSLSCKEVRRSAAQGGSDGSATLVANSASTLDPTVATLVSSEPIAGYGRAFTSHYGQLVTLTATVRQERGREPTGPVILYDVTGTSEGINVLGQVQLSNVAGVATAKLTTTSLAVGAHDIVAYYPGDSSSLASTSKDYSQQVAADATEVQLRPVPSLPFGHPALLRAVVMANLIGPRMPTGQVVFLAQGGTQYLGTAPLSTVGRVSEAVLFTTGLAPGTSNITAIYVGDTNYVSSTSATVTVVVQPPVQPKSQISP
jgi:hypothetical protein